MPKISVVEFGFAVIDPPKLECGLVDANGITDAVHPYDALWKRYVERDEKARYEPVPIE